LVAPIKSRRPPVGWGIHKGTEPQPSKAQRQTPKGISISYRIQAVK